MYLVPSNYLSDLEWVLSEKSLKVQVEDDGNQLHVTPQSYSDEMELIRSFDQDNIPYKKRKS